MNIKNSIILIKMDKVISQWQIMESVDRSKPVRIEKDVIGGAHGRPTDKLSSLPKYYKDFISEIEKCYNEYSVPEGFLTKSKATASLKQLNSKLNTTVEPNIKTVYTIITYPLSKPAIIKFDCLVPITYGVLLYIYTYAYQLVYKLEEENVGNPGLIPGMLNRAKSKGMFGIYGHNIDDLVYNGNSIIEIHDDYIICDFHCDS